MFTILAGLLPVALLALSLAATVRRRRALSTALSPRTPGRDGARPGGGPFLHWVPDHHGGWRLAGDFLPDEALRPTLHRGDATSTER